MKNIYNYNIVIVGAGQLGSRHLQSLKQIHLLSNLFVIDPNLHSLDLAKERYNQIESNNNIQKIIFSPDVKCLPEVIDFLVLATNSNGRCQIIESLISSYSIKNILLEKVLFQSIKEYYLIKELLINKQINAWVNCPRRLFPIYHEIKSWLSTGEPIYGIIDGSSWGLGCNSIHFIDLFGFLTETSEYSIDTSLLDKEIIKSKREGYVEFTGTLTASFVNGSKLILSSRKINNIPPNIYLSSKDVQLIIEEGSKCVQFKSNTTGWKWDKIIFEMPFQSQLTAGIAENILLKGFTYLTTYEQSMNLHLPFITSLIDYLSMQTKKKIESCPIT